MALCHAVSILADFKELTPSGRKLMVDILLKLISGDRKESGEIVRDSKHRG